MTGTEEKDAAIRKLIALAYDDFSHATNYGGKADCQDDKETFFVMRMGEYLPWDMGLIESLTADYENAHARGWNLAAERYARMMESTYPEEYEGICHRLPMISEGRRNEIDKLVRLQVGWMEEFLAKHPFFADRSRPIRADQDSRIDTSYETYTRGELSTYSEKTFKMYREFVEKLEENDQNLAEIIFTNIVMIYGYDSIASLERMATR